MIFAGILADKEYRINLLPLPDLLQIYVRQGSRIYGEHVHLNMVDVTGRICCKNISKHVKYTCIGFSLKYFVGMNSKFKTLFGGHPI